MRCQIEKSSNQSPKEFLSSVNFTLNVFGALRELLFERLNCKSSNRRTSVSNVSPFAETSTNSGSRSRPPRGRPRGGKRRCGASGKNSYNDWKRASIDMRSFRVFCLYQNIVKTSLYKKKMPIPASLSFIFVLLQHSTENEKLVASRIQTQIVGVEGKDADHCTTTTALTTSLK